MSFKPTSSSSTSSPFPSSSSIKSLVSDVKKRRQNRVYYKQCFQLDNLWSSGLVRCDDKSKWDQLVIDRNKNESIKYYAFNQAGSHFYLSLDILSLYQNADQPFEESDWRLAKVNLKYLDTTSGGCEYSYQMEQLLDYEERRNGSLSDHESVSILRVGSLSVEIVEPFGLYRILFNGFLNRKRDDIQDKVAAKLSISTHPTCDKFDYQYSFHSDYLSKIVERESKNATLSTKELINLVLEDRIDQPLMFQGRLEFLAGATSESHLDFIMWGSKLKKMFNPVDVLTPSGSDSNPTRESIYLWAECGHSIHLNRPVANPNLIYGLASSNLDYASYFYDVKLLKKEAENREIETSFNQVRSFAELKRGGYKIVVKGFQTKQYIIEVVDEPSNDDKASDKENSSGLFKIKINGFVGWALVEQYNLSGLLKEAQQHLWTLTIGDNKYASILASERLLGGKGNSLIELSRTTSGANSITPKLESGSLLSVPRGIIVSCVAYQVWLKSHNSVITRSIDSLDVTRRLVAARSVYKNPYSDRSLTLAQSQTILKEACQKTNALLRSCPLPEILRVQLRRALSNLFSEDDLKEPADEQSKRKLFAVRSSAVGEDSLETSAAGQMKTILDACGFESICQAIVDCWASQFEVEAVSYKTQNGMDFNLPMAVVVQELISCQVAGVAATCDPLTGDKGRLEILANVGLGEGVVSGKQTDTIRVSLESLEWNEPSEAHVGQLSLPSASSLITKLPGGSSIENYEKNHQAPPVCCLGDAQIVYLANLLLELRRASKIKDREIEWGITFETAQQKEGGSSTSSSSSGDESSPEASFHVHLLQSRPLTHLSRLSSREIDHGLDTGLASPLDVVTRANIGEVMPGSMCAMNISYFSAILTGQGRNKPFEKNHTRTAFSGDTFSFHGTIAAMVLVYTDMTTQFRRRNSKNDDMGVALRTMIGTSEDPEEEKALLEAIKNERLNPMSKLMPESLARLLALDSGGLMYFLQSAARKTSATKLEDDLTDLDATIQALENMLLPSTGDFGSSKTKSNMINAPISTQVSESADKAAQELFRRLCTRVEPLKITWRNHIRATLLSMAFNVMCMRALVQQSTYPDDMSSMEILNDFSVLMQGGGNTESGDISHLLKVMIANLVAEGLLDLLRGMNHKELYDYLMSADSKGAIQFRQFMSKNGHRAYKEFDFATLTWADEPSYIIKSLATRLKLYNEQDVEREAKIAETKACELKVRYDEIMAKLSNGKAILTGYLLPRARNATIRREQTKSQLIKAVDKYRSAFRYLGAMLCLQGKLPSAELIFQVSFHELNTLVNGKDRSDLARIIFKARRRQQRRRILNKIAFPRPVLHFPEMVEVIREVSEEQAPGTGKGSGSQEVAGGQQVRGLTSCAGFVTGRACVVNSLDEMDQVEPNDILFTYSIDISWSIYFYTLSGIVTEVGGIVSHGAVVAREYGIPTLCSAVGACSKFRTGQQVTLDANNGVCYLAEPETSGS